jgi:hypothetical protein
MRRMLEDKNEILEPARQNFDLQTVTVGQRECGRAARAANREEFQIL